MNSQEYPVRNASVLLYPSLNDWDKETNLTDEGHTDNDSKVVFADLPRSVYYVDVWEATHVDHGKGVARRVNAIRLSLVGRGLNPSPNPFPY